MTFASVLGVRLKKILDSGNVVDLGLPSGTLWAKKNIDVTQADGFAASEYQYAASYFSWGNLTGRNPSNNTFEYDWGSGNDGTYKSTPGFKLVSNIPLSQDCARIILGSPWRMPIYKEYEELFENCDFIDANGNIIPSATVNKEATVNGVVGVYLKSKINGNTIFFPCTGRGKGTTLEYKGTMLLLPTPMANTSSAGTSKGVYIGTNGITFGYSITFYYGLSIRPVI